MSWAGLGSTAGKERSVWFLSACFSLHRKAELGMKS